MVRRRTGLISRQWRIVLRRSALTRSGLAITYSFGLPSQSLGHMALVFPALGSAGRSWQDLPP